MTDPTCPIHHRALICPACAGAVGGAKRSPAKTKAAAKNAVKGALARWGRKRRPYKRKPKEETS